MDKKSLFKPVIALCLCLAGGHSQAALFDRGGGLIYDDVLDITWLQDASYYKVETPTGALVPGKLNWQDATQWVSDLNYYDSVRNTTWSDWRLPATFIDTNDSVGFDTSGQSSEMAYMYYINLGFDANESLDPSAPDPVASNYNPFDNLLHLGYWSGTQTELVSRESAWGMHFHFGYQSYQGTTGDAMRVWAVRDGDVSPVPLPPALALMLSGLALFRFIGSKRKSALS